jgi:hypothetical protein
VPSLTIGSARSKVFSANGTWVAPKNVTKVCVIATASGATFGGTGTINSPMTRILSVTPGTSYAVVVTSGTVTVSWLAVRG